MRPTRFLDPLRPPPPHLRTMARLLMYGQPPLTQPEADRFEAALHEVDPLADTWTRIAQSLPDRGRAHVQAALTGDLTEAPPELRALFRAINTEPAWLDREALDLGARTHRRTGIFGDLLLSQVSLMGGYLYEGAIRPLLFTKRLTETAARRVSETAQFVLDVTSDGGLHPHAAGYRSAIQVRLLHAHIRYHLLPEPSWRTEDWGAPLSQHDMAGTSLLFSYAYILSAQAMGMRFTRAEADALIHLWRYVGHLMGIPDDLLAHDVDSARRWTTMIALCQTEAEEGVRELGSALHGMPMATATTRTGELAARLEARARAGISRLFFGDEAGDRLGLPRTRLKYAPLAVAPMVFAAETLRGFVPGATALTTTLGGRWQRRRVERLMEGLAPLYAS